MSDDDSRIETGISKLNIFKQRQLEIVFSAAIYFYRMNPEGLIFIRPEKESYFR